LEKEYIIKRVLLISLLLIVWCVKPINENSLVDRNGVKYQQDSQNSYSGEVFDLYNNGNKNLEGSYKNGGKNGKWTVWYENGQKWSEITYKNGKKDGLEIYWYANGQMASEGTHNDGEMILQKCWDEDGNECVCSDLGRGCK